MAPNNLSKKEKELNIYLKNGKHFFCATKNTIRRVLKIQKIGDKMANTLQGSLTSKIYTISYNSIIKKATQLKKGQRICTDFLPKKICKWIMITGKDVQHQLPGKGKSASRCDMVLYSLFVSSLCQTSDASN